MNVFQELIQGAILSGVSEQTVVLLLLLPLVAGVVAAARHLLGFRGFGILIPTAIALVFVIVGVGTGILVFLAILLMATIARFILRRLHLQYLPRMALLLWLVSLGVLGIIFISPIFGQEQLMNISIFPILILILLAEDFIGVQIGKSLREATSLTLETIIIALMGYFLFNFQLLRDLALYYPHWVILSPVILNLLVGRYTGLRLLEFHRFRKIPK